MGEYLVHVHSEAYTCWTCYRFPTRPGPLIVANKVSHIQHNFEEAKLTLFDREKNSI